MAEVARHLELGMARRRNLVVGGESRRPGTPGGPPLRTTWEFLRLAPGPCWPPCPGYATVSHPAVPGPAHSPELQGTRETGAPGLVTTRHCKSQPREDHYPLRIQEAMKGQGRPGYFKGWEEAGGGRGQENHFHKRESAGAPG